MRLKKVTLNNYRCFEHLELELHPRLTVLVGENGAGKTAVLDGIATGLSPVLTYLSTAQQRLVGRGIRDEDFRVLPADPAKRILASHTQIVMQAEDELLWDVWRASAPGHEPAQKYGSANLKNRLHTVLDSIQQPSPATLPVVAYYGIQRGYVESPQRLRKTKVDYSFPVAALIGALEGRSDFREMLSWFDQEEAAENRPSYDESGDALFHQSEVLAFVRDAVTSLLGSEYLHPHFDRSHRFVVRCQSNGALLQVNQLSQGYQSMLAMAMDFSRRLGIAHMGKAYASVLIAHSQDFDVPDEPHDQSQESDSPAYGLSECLSDNAIMLVDEIDLHLHPTWQQRVLGDLMRTFPLTQFIVTTHSPQVLSTVPRECIRILRQTETGYEAVLPDFSPLAHESGEALARVMGTHNPPSSPLLDKVHEFEQLVLAGQESGERAQALHQELEQAGYQFMDSDLHTWRVLAKHRANKSKG